MAYTEYTLDQIAAKLRHEWPWADEAQIMFSAQSRFARQERQKTLRPITIHELAERWCSYEKVIAALASKRLRPLSDGRFNWLHVLAVDIGIAAMLGKPHPDDEHGSEPANRPRRDDDMKRAALNARAFKFVQSCVAPVAVPRDGQTHIYFVKSIDAGTCKIGKADDLPKRFNALQCMSGSKLQLLAYRIGPPSEERDLHRKFKDERLHGEWFTITERLRRFINKTRREYGLPEWAVET